MPFVSEKERRWMWANKPKIARRWAHEYPGQGPSNLPMYAHGGGRLKRKRTGGGKKR